MLGKSPQGAQDDCIRARHSLVTAASALIREVAAAGVYSFRGRLGNIGVNGTAVNRCNSVIAAMRAELAKV